MFLCCTLLFKLFILTVYLNYLLQYYLKLSLGLVVFSCLVSVSVSGGVGEMGIIDLATASGVAG